MDFQTVKQKLQDALTIVIHKDRHLLVNDLNERSIAHRLGVYLDPSFSDFNVDCEYNGDVDADSGRKYIWLLKSRAEELNRLTNDKRDLDQEIIDLLVYPDIIVHKRGENGPGNNLLIIEVKKSTNRKLRDWDIEKLERFTSPNDDNNFNYSFGAFVDFQIGDDPRYTVDWYQSGQWLCKH